MSQIIPLASLPDTANKPGSHALGFLGPVSPEIGTARFAFSSFDLNGYEVGTNDAMKTPAQLWWGSLKFGLLLGGIFGGLVAAILLLVGSLNHWDGASTWAVVAVVLPVLVMTLAARPKREGISVVVGDEGVDLGVVEGANQQRTMVRWDDATHAFFEHRTHIFTARAGHPKPATPTRTEVAWSVRARGEAVSKASCQCVWFNRDELEGRAHNHRAGVYHAIIQTGYARRIARATSLLASGQAVELFCIDGQTIRLSPGAGAPSLTLGNKPVSQVTSEAGSYIFRVQGTSAAIPREWVGDGFILDALALAPPNPAHS